MKDISLEIHRPVRNLTITKYDSSHGMPTTDERLVLSEQQGRQIGLAMLDGLSKFYDHGEKPEKTLAFKKTGLPTLITRLDCAISLDGSLGVFEVEDRPRGLGYCVDSGVIQAQAVHEHIGEQIGDSELTVIAEDTDDYVDGDDGSLFKVLRISELDDALRNVGRNIIRLRPDRAKQVFGEGLSPFVIPGSLAPILREGDKSNRLRTGHASRLASADHLPPGCLSFAVKPLQGTGADTVMVHLSPQDKRRLNTKHGHSMEAIQKAVRTSLDNRLMIIEPFVEPMQVTINNKPGNMILRIFGLVSRESIRVIGGLAVTRPGLVVHGASDAASTAVDIENIAVIERNKL